MSSEWVTENLPLDAQDAGMGLLWHTDSEGHVSTILTNKDHHHLFYWPYNANLTEVREKSMELLKEGRIND